MRKVKFRAFQKSKRIMHKVLEINFEGADYDLRYIKIDNGKWLYLEDDDFILMQFTGLCDRNGNEIFEGDILSETENWLGEKLKYPVVVFEEFQWILREKNIAENFWHFADDGKTHLEIIGNIHEIKTF